MVRTEKLSPQALNQISKIVGESFCFGSFFYKMIFGRCIPFERLPSQIVLDDSADFVSKLITEIIAALKAGFTFKAPPVVTAGVPFF